MEALETIEQDGWTCDIFPDFEPQSPDEWDNLASFAHTTDYTFGESVGRRYADDRRDGAYIRALAIFGKDIAGVLPAQITEHGPQVTIYESDAENANAVLYTTHKRVTELCGDDPKYHDREWVENALRGELAVWRQYLEGDVYGVVVKRPDGTVDESLWGCYGFDYAKEEAAEMLAAGIAHEARTVEEVSRIVAL